LTTLLDKNILLHKTCILYNNNRATERSEMAAGKGSRRRSARVAANPRRNAVLKTVRQAGLLVGARSRIAGRIRQQLLKAAKARSGIESDTELLEYAIARVALEDDFGRKLIAREGRVPQDLDLEL
jgi:hypothetical protein